MDKVNPKAQKRIINFTNALIFETPGGRRFTQDSPILPNVWLDYALAPRKPQKLILTLNRDKGGGQAAHELREMLKRLRKRLVRRQRNLLTGPSSTSPASW